MPSAVRPSWNHNPAPRVMSLKRVRFWLICLFFLFWAILIAARLFSRSAPGSSSSAPSTWLRAAVCSMTATCASWP
jgi:membrane protein YdbS with pleckstrin-like domain